MRIFKEINWALQEVARYFLKYGTDISEAYLAKIIKEDLIFNKGDVIKQMLEYKFVRGDGNKIYLTDLGKKIVDLVDYSQDNRHNL